MSLGKASSAGGAATTSSVKSTPSPAPAANTTQAVSKPDAATTGGPPSVSSPKDSVTSTGEQNTKDAKPNVNFEAWTAPTPEGMKTSDQAKNELEPSSGFSPEMKSSDQAKDEQALAKAREKAEALGTSLGDKTLRNGMHNESVRSLQSALNEKLGLELENDGKFGRKTRDAVKQFQKSKGLTPDGVVGPKTKAALTGIDDINQAMGKTEGEDGATTDGVTSAENDPNVKPKEGTYSFGSKLNGTQKKAVDKMVTDLKAKGFDVKADDIINFMAVETGGTFSPSVRAGGKKNGAVGLAQFTGIAIKDMNRFRKKGNKLSKSKLSKMTFGEQSEVVTEYLSTALGRRKMQGKNISAGDLYTAVFAPAHIGKAPGATLYRNSGRTRRAYRANRSLDRNRDGVITKSELTHRLNAWVARGEKLRG